MKSGRSALFRCFVHPASRGKSDSAVTVLAIEQALVDLGIRASLSDIAGGAQAIEKAITQSRLRCKREPLC